MIRFKSFLGITILECVTPFVVAPGAAAQDCGLQVLKIFDSQSGISPNFGVIQGADGLLYGTTTLGGANGVGTVFKMNKDGTNFSVILNFDWNTLGANPAAGVTQFPGNPIVLGVASNGGSGHGGTLIAVGTDGSQPTALIAFDQSGANGSGHDPQGRLTIGSNLEMFGTTIQGGSSNHGTLFALLPTNYYQCVVLSNFDGDDGAQPVAGVIQGTDGNLYGTTWSGGTSIWDGNVFTYQVETASASNYGSGLAGTNGVPNLSAWSVPVIGSTTTITIDNSRGALTNTVLCAGLSRSSLNIWGGTLLVGNIFLFLPIQLPSAGLKLFLAIPDSPCLCGYEFEMQALELDPGAPKGVSFTPGLDLKLGLL